MFVSTKYRSTAAEIMDDFEMEGEILRDALDKIARINQLLGGNKITLEGVKILMKEQPKSIVTRIVDIGCGNGDMLRALAKYADRNNLNFVLTGIDANQFTIRHAEELSFDYLNISYKCADIFNELESPQQYDSPEQYDIILCTLTLHHFKDEEIVTLLKSFQTSARLGFVINDLQRSAIAYYLFKALCFAFKLNDMSRGDGLVSILRGFKRKDLVRYCKALNIENCIIRWKWAFRYQWIVKNI